MGNSTEICTDGELKFGFVRETYYPLHTTCLENYGNKQNQQLVPFGKLCKRPGVIAEILDQLGSTFNCRIKWLKFPVYGGLRANESGHFAGLLGALQEGKVDMAATILTQSVSRNEHFHPSTTFATAERLAAVIGRAPNENHTRNLSLFVFNPEVFLLLFGLMAVQALVMLVAKGEIQLQLSTFWSFFHQTIQFSGVGLRFYQQVFVFGFFAIYLAYFAKFRSEAVPKLELGHVDGLDLIQTIKSGQKILLIETRDSLKPTRFRLFNTTDLIDGRILAAGSSERAQRMLCQDDKYLYLNEIIPFYAANLNNYPCSFQSYEIIVNDKTITETSPAVFYTRKDMAKIYRETVDQLILKFLSEVQMKHFWYSRYNMQDVERRIRNIPDKDAVSQGPISISMKEFRPGLIFWISSMLSALILLIFEHFCAKYALKSRFLAFCKRAKMHCSEVYRYIVWGKSDEVEIFI